MIKAEQIPDEVIVAACEEYGGGHLVDMKHAIAAAINAWPGMEIEKVFVDEDYLILPLPRQNSNG